MFNHLLFDGDCFLNTITQKPTCLLFRQAVLLSITVLILCLWQIEVFADEMPNSSPLRELPEIKSVNGVLTTTFEAKEQKVQLGSVAFDGRVYNGDYAGPVLRVHPGDLMLIKLINRLSNPTNLHFHGIDTSPRGNSDNIHVLVQPGDTFDYEIRIPVTQPPGLYWFHDHAHGVSDGNVMGGLSGTIIVEGFEQQFPELADVQEHLFVLKDYKFETSDDPYIHNQLHKIVQTINGQTFSEITMRPGETQLWRFTNQSADFIRTLSLTGHKFRIIGDDGLAALKETETDTLTIKPAERLEVLVDAGDAGSYDLVAHDMLTGDAADRKLGRVIVSGEPMKPVPLITSFPAREDLRNRKIDTYRTIVFSQAYDKKKDDMRYFINGREFDHDRIDTRVPLGSTEEWTIKNDSDDFHEFHIHQVSFQVTEVNGQPQPFNSWIDTVRIPERGEVKIRMAFTDPNIVGTFVYHCHILSHEDNGMMAQIEVYDPKVSSVTRFWREMFSCCSSMKFNGGCFGSNLQRLWASLVNKQI